MKMFTPGQLAEILKNNHAWNLDGCPARDPRRADLRYADLRYADLSSADLRSADLSSANLRSADLRSANLRSADLRSADLRSADLSSADLRSANLSYANLSSAIGGTVCRMDFGGWSICIRSDRTSIGCQVRTNEEWLSATEEFVSSMHDDAWLWWKIHGDAIRAAIRCVMAKAADSEQAST